MNRMGFHFGWQIGAELAKQLQRLGHGPNPVVVGIAGEGMAMALSVSEHLRLPLQLARWSGGSWKINDVNQRAVLAVLAGVSPAEALAVLQTIRAENPLTIIALGQFDALQAAHLRTLADGVLSSLMLENNPSTDKSLPLSATLPY